MKLYYVVFLSVVCLNLIFEYITTDNYLKLYSIRNIPTHNALLNHTLTDEKIPHNLKVEPFYKC